MVSTPQVGEPEVSQPPTASSAARIDPSWQSKTFYNDEEDIEDEEAGPSDSYQHQPGTPLTVFSEDCPDSNWRKPSSEGYGSDILTGPSDYWSHETRAVNQDMLDEGVYKTRISDFLSQEEDNPDSLGSSTSEALQSHPAQSLHGNTILPKPTHNSFKGNGSSDRNGESGIDEEEFGQQRHLAEGGDTIEQTHSTTSLAPTRLKESAYPYRAMPSPNRTSFIHPSISRLRSHMRFSSSTTQQSLQNPQFLGLRLPSHFSQISDAKSETMSTGSTPVQPASLQNEIPTPSRTKELEPAFQFHPLRKLSAHAFSRDKSGMTSPRPQFTKKATSILGVPLGSPLTEVASTDLGNPTVMDICGMVAIGTNRGHVVIYGFGQDIRYFLQSETTDFSVTALTISPDQAYVAVGLSSGDVHLYDLSAPNKPSRTAHALTLKQVQSGKREGHLQCSRILHVGFVGSRHTSIVTGDEHGRAFWWSLGKVMGVESTDVIRILGSYPSPTLDPHTQPPYPSKKPTILFSTSPLPLGDAPHPTDVYNLTALLTPSKLVVVGMKPQAKTWFRKIRNEMGGEMGGICGCVAWLRPERANGNALQHEGHSPDPVLAYSWGKALRLVEVRVQGQGDDVLLDFTEGKRWDAKEAIRFLGWYDINHLILIMSSEMMLLDMRSMQPAETTPLDTNLLTAHDFYSGLCVQSGAPECFAGSTRKNLQVGTLLHWSDRILSQVHRGDFLQAISVALSYYSDTAQGNTIGLPPNILERQQVIANKIKELMKASLEWAFSPERLVDDTHFSMDGRGVDLTSLFEGLASSCIEACSSIEDLDFLFEKAYDYYLQAGIQGLFLNTLEPFIFSGKIKEVPPTIIKALIILHDEKGELDIAESVIWHVDPISLDINQAITFCEANSLWDAMIHVYTRAMRDYVAPIVKLLGVVRSIQQNRLHRPFLVGDEKDETEEMAPNAYKLYSYIEAVLSGFSYPSGEPLSEEEGLQAKTDVYTFLFQGRTVAWPQGSDTLVLTVEDQHMEPPYPYLSLLLHFDTEAFLHSMDIAFEDSYLNDPVGAINRQSIVNLMLDVMDPEYFHPGDITFLHIFVAQNLPKYPQFLFIPPSTLHRILFSLASDSDQSTREDRQLAAEYLLSAYTPHDQDEMLVLFDRAGFFRILESAYRKEEKWGKLISTSLKDPDSNGQVFASLDEIIKTASPSEEVLQAMVDALPQLFELGVQETAILLDRNLYSLHSRAIASLDHSPHKQMAYLRCLLEPDVGESGIASPSSHVDTKSRHLYIDLLAKHDPGRMISFLDDKGKDFFDLDKLLKQCEHAGLHEAELWTLDRQGKVKETFVTAGDMLRTQGAELGNAMMNESVGSIHMVLETIQGITKMSVRLCKEHSQAEKAGKLGTKQVMEIEMEDMWLQVLHEIIELIHTSSSLTSFSSIDTVVLDTLRALVQEALASLVSSSSPSLSFPRLFKRLVDASTSTSTQRKGRAYSEFRSILMGMLDSYRAEGEMLSITTKLVETDLGEVMAELVRMSKKGWCPQSNECRECQRMLRTEEAWVVRGSGEVVHQNCSEKRL
nr:hypothetical protein L204_05147 [Cryptococcus depauperatus CBS 7855]